MFSAFQTFGRLGAGARAVAAAWTPAALWPTGTEPGMWIDPSNLATSWQDSTGTTPVSTPGTVADSSNPVGLALDLRLGASVLTDPGNHLLQATSTARPLLSGRVNLITGSEDFSDGATWGANATTLSDGFVEGGVAFSKFIETATDFNHDRYAKIGLTSGVHYIYSAKFKAAERTIATIRTWDATYASDAANTTYFNLSTQEVQLASNGVTTGGMIDEGGGIYRCWVGITPNHNTGVGSPTYGMSTGMGVFTYLGDGTSGLYVGGAQVEAADSLGVYQAVSASGIYPATGVPIFQKYDGTDDGMATAPFAAGTLSSAMDCMIAVRRDSAGNAVCGLYESVAEANKVFGIAESGSGSGCVGSGAGTPTVWVDGVQLTGGTAVTRGTLHTALTVGDWHILECRGLDLSTWAGSGFGLYTGWLLLGAQGGILLFPSSTSAADRDAARTWLGAKVGLTL